jgi:hypothetical protein
MTISKLIQLLEEAQKIHGDVECLIEVATSPNENIGLVPVGEINFENRNLYGDSITLLC